MATGQQKSLSVSKSDITTFNTTKDATWTPSEWSSVSNAIPDYSIITALSLKMEFYQLTANGNYKIIAGSTTLINEQSGVGDHSETANVLGYVTTTGVNAGTLTSNIILRVSSGLVTRTWKNIKATLTWTYTTPTFKISLTAGTGGTVSGAGTYEVGSSATIKATPNSGYRFVKWSDGNTSATRTITKTTSDISANVTNLSYSAVFEKITYTITTAVSPTGTGTVTGGGTYEQGKTATLTATPNTGYKFVKWSDGNTSATRTVTVTANATYTAIFEIDKINKIYVGTAQPSKIYVGTQEVKEVYVGTTKVYG